MQKFSELQTANSYLHSRVKRDDDTTPTQIPPSQITPSQITMYTAEEVKTLLETEVHKAVEEKIESAIETRINKVCDSIQKRCGDKEGLTVPSSNKRRGQKGEPGERGPRGEKGERGYSLLLPDIRHSNLDVFANETESVRATCEVYGYPIPTIKWVSDAHNTTIEISIDHANSLVVSVLHLQNVSRTDQGTIKCMASSVLGSTEASGTLGVFTSPLMSLTKSQPVITEETDVLIAKMGTSFVFPICATDAFPRAQPVWKRGFGDLPEGRSLMTVDGSKAKLLLQDVKAQDGGYYICEAENYLGRASKSVLLQVQPLSFYSRPALMKYLDGYQSRLFCSALGSGNMKVTWTTLESNKKLWSQDTLSSDGITSMLIARTVGTYMCSISMGRVPSRQQPLSKVSSCPSIS